MQPILTLLALAIALGGSILPSQADTGHHPSHDAHPSQPHDHGSGHDHRTLDIPAGQPVPTVTVVAHPDPVRGWNLNVQTTHFRFAPEHVNQANQPGEGHGHLYINGEYYSRVYGHWLHLPSLPSGHNELTVSLNANDHAALTHNGQRVEATVVVHVP